jgi:hypothetical protein
MSQHSAPDGTAEITLRLSAAELAQLDAWSAAQADRPTRVDAVSRMVRRALGLRIADQGHGLRSSELNAENDG